ncbi:MAG: eukaryotic-like serine/threonine-protein kinase [Actinomycetota bacterium]|nr:eukaryotic-like serine/threonine-protein kinase [Actinomycetota bacterium]
MAPGRPGYGPGMAGECAVDQLLGGRYALVEVLGHGASGVVWRARDQLLERDVAVKEIRSPLVVGVAEEATFREAILREARAAARLNHSGAVTVYDVVEEDGRPLIVMELVDAPTLADLVESGGPLPPEEAAAIGAQLVDALDAGHAAGIVHRDVKPRNVMVGASGRVRLADFGVAAVLDDARMTSGNAVVGSPAFMAPEQVTGGEIGWAADIWALGATLYYAVEGRPPYDKGAVIPTMTAIVLEAPRPPERAGPLAPLLESLLSKDPAARPPAAFVRRRLESVAASGRAAQSDELDPTSQFPAPSLVDGPPVAEDVVDIEVPGPPQPPAGPIVPGPVSPGGPDVVVIPEPTPSTVPPPGPSVPMSDPAPEPAPDEPPPTQPAPDVPVPAPPAQPRPIEPPPTQPVPAEPVPEPLPPERVPPEPRPEPVPTQPGPGRGPAEPDPLRVPSEPDPLLVPTERVAMRESAATAAAAAAAATARGGAGARVTAPAAGRATRALGRSRGVGPWLAAAVVAVAVVLVAVVLTGRDRGSGTGQNAGGQSAGGQTSGGQAASDGSSSAATSPGPTSPAAKSAGSAAVSSSAKVPGDWVSYADPATGFTIAHPPDWELVVSDSLTDFRDPSSGAYLRVDHVQPPGPSPEGAWLEFEPRFAADHEGYQRIRIQPATYAGFPAAIWEYTYGGGGARLRAVDLGFVTGSYGFALNFQTREADWDRLQPVFDAFRASFKAPAA